MRGRRFGPMKATAGDLPGSAQTIIDPRPGDTKAKEPCLPLRLKTPFATPMTGHMEDTGKNIPPYSTW